MENLEFLLHGISVVFTLQNVIATIAGAILGLIVGAMPGIGSLAGVALLLPITFAFNPITGIIMLGGLYYANMYGGAFSAILLNIPGDTPAVVTTFDGYPLANSRKRPGQALFISNISSFIGGLIGITILVFTGSALANFGLQFGPAEMTALMLLAMTSIGWLMGENPTKGLLLTMLGILLASIGMDALTGRPRYEFGSMYLLGGIPFAPFVIGLVGFAQVIRLMEERKATAKITAERLTIRGSIPTKSELKRALMPAVRGGLIGTVVGVLPGAGATTASFIGYSVQQKFKNEVPLGSGAIEGLAACESSNNGAAAGAFAPLLALGIPGSGTGAVLLAGLMMWGLNPGPLLFVNEPDFAWGLIASLFLANILTLIAAWGVIPFLVKILSVPTRILIPVITVICVVGAYSTTYSMYGVVVMLLSGVLGYVLVNCKYSVVPILLSFVLAPIIESNMRQAFIISRGSVAIFFQKPISLVLLIFLFLILVSPIIISAVKKVQAAR